MRVSLNENATLCLDEVSWVLDLKEERQGILCGGFERNGYAEVCEGENTAITTRLFSTYCPKAFGLIGKLTPTLTDRSIVIQCVAKHQLKRPNVCAVVTTTLTENFVSNVYAGLTTMPPP